MTEREQMIGLLKEAYEELERTGEDRCECDESVALMCYFCRLREMLHKVDPEWTCAFEDEFRYSDRCYREVRGFWDDWETISTGKPSAWMPESAKWTDEDEAQARVRHNELLALLEAHPELKEPIETF